MGARQRSRRNPATLLPKRQRRLLMQKQQPFKTTFPLFNHLTMERTTFAGQPIFDIAPKLFDIDNVAAYVEHTMPPEASSKNGKSIIEQAGPLRLPYKKMWVEFQPGQKIWGNLFQKKSGHNEEPPTYYAGAFLQEFHPDDPERDEFLRTAQVGEFTDDVILLLMTFHDSYGMLDQNHWAFLVNPNGDLVFEASASNQSGNALFQKFGLDADAITAAMSLIAAPVIIAIGLMNCRNIETENRTTKPTSKRKHRKRITTPGTEYKVIKLPGAPSNRVDGEVKNEGNTRYHTVRGHFKTYTEEKPLYGKLTGTWWWAPSVRGKKENGEIISTYKQDVA